MGAAENGKDDEKRLWKGGGCEQDKATDMCYNVVSMSHISPCMRVCVCVSNGTISPKFVPNRHPAKRANAHMK